MTQCQIRMAKDHAGTRIPHDLDNFCSHVSFVTVNRAIGTRRFVLLKGTLVQPFLCIVEKLLTFFAQLLGGKMMCSAVNSHHRSNCCQFPTYSVARPGHNFHERSRLSLSERGTRCGDDSRIREMMTSATSSWVSESHETVMSAYRL